MSGKRSRILSPVCWLLLLSALFSSCGASVTTDNVFLEDDEDSYVVGSFSLTLLAGMSCSGEWYTNNIQLINGRLHNSIAEDIRRLCGECPFNNDNLRNILLTCQHSTQSLNIRASIENWVSDSFPVVHILNAMSDLYRDSSTEVIIATDGFLGDFLPLELRLVPTNITSLHYSVSSGSGEGAVSAAVTVEEIISTEPEVEIKEVSSSKTTEMKYVYTKGNLFIKGKGLVGSDSAPRHMLSLLIMMVIIARMLI